MLKLSALNLLKKLALFAAILLVTVEMQAAATPSYRKRLVSAMKTRSELPLGNANGTGSESDTGAKKVEAPGAGANDSKNDSKEVSPTEALGLKTNNSTVEGTVITNSEGEKEIVVEEEKLQEIVAIISSNSSSNATEVAVAKPSYLTKVKNLLLRVLDLLGFTKQRKSRAFSSGPRDNTLDSNRADFFSEEIKSAVGAFLGKKQCMKRAVCGAGAFLRNIRGKEVLIVFLEKVTPQTWTKAMDQVKEAAIYNDTCDYECIDE